MNSNQNDQSFSYRQSLCKRLLLLLDFAISHPQLLIIVAFVLSVARYLITDWSSLDYDIHRYSSFAMKIEDWFVDFSPRKMEIIFQDYYMVKRFLFPLLLAVPSYILNVDHVITASIISIVSGLISLWVLKGISETIGPKSDGEEQYEKYALWVVTAFGTSSIFIRSFVAPNSDMLALCLVLLSIRFFFSHLRKNSVIPLLLSIIIATIGFFEREVIILLLLAYLLYPTGIKKKINHFLFIGIPLLLLTIYLLTSGIFILNTFARGLGFPQLENDLVLWIIAALETRTNLWNQFPLLKLFISHVSLLFVLVLALYRVITIISHKKRYSLDLQLLYFLGFWFAFYEIIFTLLWIGAFVQRFWLLNSFFLFQIALLPSVSYKRKIDSISLFGKGKMFLYRCINERTFVLIVICNLIYEITTLLLA